MFRFSGGAPSAGNTEFVVKSGESGHLLHTIRAAGKLDLSRMTARIKVGRVSAICEGFGRFPSWVATTISENQGKSSE